jgi:uncharacterized membrane protein
MRVLAVGAVVWVAAIVLAPSAVASRWPVVSVGGAAIYVGGSRVCHQRAERSFWIHGRPMPVCARCTGLYASAAVAAPFALLLASAVSSRRARRIAVVAALPTLLTWSLEQAGVADPSNIVRALAALPLGFAAAWLVVTVTRTKH